jgi:hypothetical protein
MAVLWVVEPSSPAKGYRRFKVLATSIDRAVIIDSEISVKFYQTTRRNNSEGRYFQDLRFYAIFGRSV